MVAQCAAHEGVVVGVVGQLGMRSTNAPILRDILRTEREPKVADDLGKDITIN